MVTGHIRSTSTAVLALTQQINIALNETAVVVFLDIRKALDSVNMLAKLHDYGFRGKIHQLLNTFPTDNNE